MTQCNRIDVLRRLARRAIPAGITLAAILAASTAARADELIVNNSNAGAVSVFDAASGATIDTALISGFAHARGLALSGQDLYVVDSLSATLGEYNVSSGAPISAPLVSTGSYGEPEAVAVSGSNYYVSGYGNSFLNGYGPSGLTFNDTTSAAEGNWALAISGNTLYVGEATTFSGAGHDVIATYNATTGALINPDLVTGLSWPEGMTIVGNNLYVVNNADYTDNGEPSGSVGLYNALTGQPINASLVTGLYQPTGIAVNGNDLYVVSDPNAPLSQFPSNTSGVIGEYNATTGATINASLVTGLNDPQGLVYLPTPEPATWMMLVVGAAGLMAVAARRKRGSV
ncbi:MAG TPA: PEP-CTERM sorting domain-containing protein [Pirellulales bacterium]|nr:PEP-CTERM sorting domain-containing protein [Pirellulales bacterium]